jgi:hypothetical protein
MTSITNSSVKEDRYLAHLAGMKGGKNIIGFYDRYWAAPSAQKHPIANSISASIMGLIKGGVLTTCGVLASPLMNSSTRSSIFGSSTWDVCTACGVNAKSLGDLIFKVQNILDPKNAQSYFDQTMEVYKLSLSASAQCAIDDQALMVCRAGNYASGIVDTLPITIC